MSFDKHYPNRKDRRKPYRRRGKYDASCRPHGGCWLREIWGKWPGDETVEEVLEGLKQ